MRHNVKLIKRCSCLVLAAALLTGCSVGKNGESSASRENESRDFKGTGNVAYEVDPSDFSLSISSGGELVLVSLPGKNYRVEGIEKEGDETRWTYPDEKIAVSVKPEQNYLHVTITSEHTEDNEFQWPYISGDTYYLPFGEGKRIPGNDPEWGQYLKSNSLNVMEQLSMPFWAAVSGDHAVLCIMENPYRSELVFSDDDPVKFRLVHRYPQIDQEKKNSFRFYLTDNNPVSVAKIYRQYRMEQGEFVTLEEKADKNPDIRKLYGAPQIYLWGDNLIAPEDIKWQVFKKSLDSPVLKRAVGFASRMEIGQEALKVFDSLAEQDYVDQYQKNIICRYLSEVLKSRAFYDSDIFAAQDEIMKEYLKKGIDGLDESSLIQFNKHALAANLSEAFEPVDTWMNGSTVDLIKDLKASGIEQAWIGLNSWEQAYAKPELAETAVKQGYLIGPYDSYHSIHKPGEEQWITAKFEDSSLYDHATVLQQNGEKAAGFQNVGRKLNPVLSMPSVKQRIGEIMAAGIPFNSWFIDCDATGEIYDDYSPEHVTTKQEDLAARLERMAYIRDEHNMVIGSEGGNDFAASAIAFAHGIELKSFSWIDKDMKSNKESEYYIGKYYSPTGGVAEHFSKRIPVKDEYYKIFAAPEYDLPLFKLVYNESVITSYHWDWSTFKIKGATADRMLREVLYDVPPLYHLDREEWETYKEDIISHTKVWAEFSRQAVTQEMTDFKYLKEDGSVQMTRYGESIEVTANFGDVEYSHEGNIIPGHSLLLNMDGEVSVYTPEISEENR